MNSENLPLQLQFVAPDIHACLYIGVPRHSSFALLLQSFIIGHLPNLPVFTIVTDDECAPDVRNATVKDNHEVPIPGWVKQQLLKLAAAGLMQTPYYMVMDSDVFFTKHCKAEDLFKVSACTNSSLICDLHGKPPGSIMLSAWAAETTIIPDRCNRLSCGMLACLDMT